MLRSPYSHYSKFIAKLNPDGNTLWAKTINETHYGFDYNQMDIDQEGNVYFGLAVKDTIYFGNDFIYPNTGYEDLIIAKYTSGGELDWVKSIASTQGTNRIAGIAVSADNSLYAGGLFNNSLDFEGTVLTSNNQHGFLAHLGEPSGINNYNKEQNNFLFEIYPNPGEGVFSVLKQDDCPESFEVIITDLTGREMGHYKIQFKKTIVLDLTTMPKGMYFIKLKSVNRSGCKKVLIY